MTSKSVVDRWVDSIPNPHTRKQYRANFAKLQLEFELVTDGDLQRLTSADVAAWIASLRDSGLSSATLNSHRVAVSSFYRFARQTEGWTTDPVNGIKSQRVNPYGRSRYPSTNQVAQLLATIPTDSIHGKRNLAVVLGLYVTTRRVNEWIGLQWGHIHRSRSGYWFAYRAKGGGEFRQAIPADLWDVILEYLTAARRWPLQAADSIFVSLPGHPLTAGYVRRVLRQYGREAGLPEDVCHPHGLRHAGARARKAAGQTPWELQEVLGHKDIRTTIIYSRTVLDEPVDEYGDGLVTAVLPPRKSPSRDIATLSRPGGATV